MIFAPTLLRPVAALLALAGLADVPAAAAAPAAELFFRKPALGAPTLSPSGKQIAMLVPTASGRLGLAVADIGSPTRFKGVAQFDDADVRSVKWVNNERLVFDLTDQQKATDDQLGSGLYAVNADGSAFAWLIKRTRVYAEYAHLIERVLPVNYRFAGVAGDGSDDVLVLRYESEGQGRAPKVEPMRLNTRTVALRRRAACPRALTGSCSTAICSRAPSSPATASASRWCTGGKGGASQWSELYRFNHAEDLTATMPLGRPRRPPVRQRRRRRGRYAGAVALRRQGPQGRRQGGAGAARLRLRRPALVRPGDQTVAGRELSAGGGRGGLVRAALARQPGRHRQIATQYQ